MTEIVNQLFRYDFKKLFLVHFFQIRFICIIKSKLIHVLLDFIFGRDFNSFFDKVIMNNQHVIYQISVKYTRAHEGVE